MGDNNVFAGGVRGCQAQRALPEVRDQRFAARVRFAL